MRITVLYFFLSELDIWQVNIITKLSKRLKYTSPLKVFILLDNSNDVSSFSSFPPRKLQMTAFDTADVSYRVHTLVPILIITHITLYA